jgi:hypothetical protein
VRLAQAVAVAAVRSGDVHHPRRRTACRIENRLEALEQGHLVESTALGRSVAGRREVQEVDVVRHVVERSRAGNGDSEAGNTSLTKRGEHDPSLHLSVLPDNDGPRDSLRREPGTRLTADPEIEEDEQRSEGTPGPNTRPERRGRLLSRSSGWPWPAEAVALQRLSWRPLTPTLAPRRIGHGRRPDGQALALSNQLGSVTPQ